MMVRYLTCMSGDYHVRNVGDVAEVDAGEALRLVAAGFAELEPTEAGPGQPDAAVEPEPAKPKRKGK